MNCEVVYVRYFKEKIMKFIKISLLASLLISTSAIAQQFAATGIHACFGVNSVNPIATFQNVSKYMESADFKKLLIIGKLCPIIRLQ